MGSSVVLHNFPVDKVHPGIVIPGRGTIKSVMWSGDDVTIRYRDETTDDDKEAILKRWQTLNIVELPAESIDGFPLSNLPNLYYRYDVNSECCDKEVFNCDAASYAALDAAKNLAEFWTDCLRTGGSTYKDFPSFLNDVDDVIEYLQAWKGDLGRLYQEWLKGRNDR